MLPNSPITKAEILQAEDILGPNLGSLKRKTTRNSPSRVIMNTCTELPNNMLEIHGNVILAVDLSYINKISFMTMTSWDIHFGMAELKKMKKWGQS